MYMQSPDGAISSSECVRSTRAGWGEISDYGWLAAEPMSFRLDECMNVNGALPTDYEDSVIRS